MRVFVVVLSVLILGVSANGDSKTVTTATGAPLDQVTSSETVGTRGPILLQDARLIERIQIHNRERIPERVVHARGATAKGVFRVTKDVTDLTVADFLSEVGKETPLASRWSTVIHSKESPEFLRDPRGFALKFYTNEGNYDVVGLNFPVFFIRDAMRFPDMIRSLKPNPVTGLSEWWRTMDFFSNYPESLHMFTWLMDDGGIPASYRTLDGYGVHTYLWLNQKGQSHYVRYYWKSWQGVVSLLDDEAVTQFFSNATADLYQKIAEGDFPGWTLYVQAIDTSDTEFINSLSFDPLDTTKQWPEDIIPLREVGEMVFNENVKNQYLENEQIAFSPSHFVPGIEASDEKMLQLRMFAYPDTQNYRLGVNHQMLPINKPRCPFRDPHLEGDMNFQEGGVFADEVNYYPSKVDTKVHVAAKQHHDRELLKGHKVEENINKTNDFEQPRNKYRSLPADRKERLAMRLAVILSGDRVPADVLDIWLGWWHKVDAELGKDVAKHVTALRNLAMSEIASNDDEVRAYQSFRDAFLVSSGSAL